MKENRADCKQTSEICTGTRPPSVTRWSRSTTPAQSELLDVSRRKSKSRSEDETRKEETPSRGPHRLVTCAQLSCPCLAPPALLIFLSLASTPDLPSPGLASRSLSQIASTRCALLFPRVLVGYGPGLPTTPVGNAPPASHKTLISHSTLVSHGPCPFGALP